MIMEGTGKYFIMLFFVFFIVYVAVKISLGFLFKRARVDAWRAYIPFYTTYVLIDILEMKKINFYLSLIPIVNLYFYNKIIKELLKAFNQNPKDSIWYVVFPMYNFPKLAFQNPKFILNEYELTEEFIKTENILFDKPKDKEEIKGDEVMNKDQTSETETEQNNDMENSFANDENAESVFTNEALEPDETHTTYVEVEPEEPEEEKPIITPAATGRPQMCPNCGARLAPDAEVCFLCGTKL